MTLPISLAEAKRQLRVDGNDQDDEIEGMILDAAAWVEDYTGQILVARDVTEQFCAPGRTIDLRAWPIFADAALTVEAAGQTTASPLLDVSRRPARLALARGTTWPTTDPAQPITVTVRAGYEDPDDVPRALCRAMLVLVSAFDDDREGGNTFAKAEVTAKNLCRRYKRHSL